MKRLVLAVLSIILVIILLGCTNKNPDNVDAEPFNSEAFQSDIDTGNNVPINDMHPDDDVPQNNMHHNDDTPIDNIRSDDNINLNNNNSEILDSINKDTLNLAKYILDMDINLEGMENEYGPIIEVDWIEGGYYRHEKLNLWVAYYTIGIEESFVVSFEGKEPETVLFEVDGVQYKKREYKKGPYTILEDAKKAPILRVKCQLSDLFDEPSSLSIEDFASFAIIYESLEWTGQDIIFNYDELTITIMVGSDNTLHSDCEVFIE